MEKKPAQACDIPDVIEASILFGGMQAPGARRCSGTREECTTMDEKLNELKWTSRSKLKPLMLEE